MPGSRAFNFLRRPLPAAGLLAGLILGAYAWSLPGEFLWDDDLHITANPTIIGPLGLKEIWTSARANYFPLVLTNFWLQHALWGLEPLGYRIVTLVFHVGAALLLWRVLAQLRVPGSWWGAALWALHPVQVESVAWICELKNTQSAVFFLAAVLWYSRWLEPRVASPDARPARGTGGRCYGLALLFAGLAILSKPSTVMLPVALALVAWWVRRRVDWRDWLPLAPFLALSALAAGWTIWEQKHHSGAIGPEWSQTLPERFVIAGRVIWFYLGKLLWPEPLLFIYPRWAIAADGPLAFAPLAAALGGLAGLWHLGRRWRAGAAGFLAAAFFIALLFPVLGFFNVYFFRYSFVGDHFQYLASMGPLALGGVALARLAGEADAVARDGGWRRWPAAAVLLACTLLAARESREYLDNERLWRATLARNPDATMAWLNLGDTLLKRGRLLEAETIFRKVARQWPASHDAHNDLGGILLLRGRAEEARAALARAVELAPRRPEVHNNLGNALRLLGRAPEALACYRRAVELDPEYAEARGNLAAELADAGRAAESLAHFETALRLSPRNAIVLNHLAGALRTLGRFDEALARHREALEVRPDLPEAWAGLGYTLVRAGRGTEGVPALERAVALNPDHAGIRGLAGRGLAAAGRPAEALSHFQRAVELAPHLPDAHQNLGAALAQAGRSPEALPHFQRAVELAPESAGARFNLGNALLAATRWSEAAREFEWLAQAQPDNAAVHIRLAVARVNAGRLEEALPAFGAALRLQPGDAGVHDQLGQVLRALGRNREALEHFERAAELRRGGGR